MILDFPRTHPNVIVPLSHAVLTELLSQAIIEVASKVLLKGRTRVPFVEVDCTGNRGKESGRRGDDMCLYRGIEAGPSYVCLDCSVHMVSMQIAAAMGISIAKSRVMEMIRKANLVRAERIAQVSP